MTQRSQRLLVLIVIVIGLAIYIVWPNSPGIHIDAIGLNKDFETRLGLDLVGGVQALLEADLPPGTPIDSEAMSAATNIVENRVNGIGVTEAVVQQAGDNRIVVELPGETNPEAALATLQQTGLLEFVDMSGFDQQQIALLQGGLIKTDFGMVQSESVTSTQEITSTLAISPTFHTIMTGADLKAVQVEANSSEWRISNCIPIVR